MQPVFQPARLPIAGRVERAVSAFGGARLNLCFRFGSGAPVRDFRMQPFGCERGRGRRSVRANDRNRQPRFARRLWRRSSSEVDRSFHPENRHGLLWVDSRDPRVKAELPKAVTPLELVAGYAGLT